MTNSSHERAQPTLLLAVLLGASLGGCFSLEPLSSYSSGGPGAQEPPSTGDSAPSASGSEAIPAQTAPDGQAVSEGLPGEGDIALEPALQQPDAMQPDAMQSDAMQSDAMQPDAMQAESPASQPAVMPPCAGPGEFSSADGQTCYRAVTQSAIWMDAFTGCQTWGGGLAIIDSREEDELIGQHIAASSWIGASDLVQEGRMLWIGGAPVTFGNWALGQPDDFQGREDCVVKTVPAGSWNDLPCRNLNAYVCERRED
jgi:hypothetical protein